MIADQLEAILENGHHAESEEIDFDDAEIGAVFLVPLHDDAAGHGGGFERNDVIETSLADDHAAGVLAEMARHVLQGYDDIEKFADLQVVEVEAGFAELFFLCVFFVVIAPHGGEGGNFVERGHIEAEDFARFARGEASAIRDDVGGHGGAVFSVALVDVLNDALALIAAGEIDIDVGPFAALFGEEALEEEVHADGVDGGDAEGVADGAVGGGTASLAEDALFAGEADEVPDDEEVAAEAELFDEREFLFDLLAGAVVIGLIAAARAFVSEFGEEGGDGFVGRKRVFGELIAEVGEGEVRGVRRWPGCWRWLRGCRRRAAPFRRGF